MLRCVKIFQRLKAGVHAFLDRYEPDSMPGLTRHRSRTGVQEFLAPSDFSVYIRS